jgi:pantoate--beta-alanine ligase
MNIINDPQEMRCCADHLRAEGKTIGLVPTMGALHAGHMSLVHAALRENDVAAVSIFVNPTQFAPHEDFGKYPRTFQSDIEQLKAAGVSYVYAPSAESMYPEDFVTYVEIGKVTEGLCGGSRPQFFRGVATVVMKLFHAVKPHRAYFGQKDVQQCAVIKRMVRDMDMGVDIIILPVVREPDGLAMSSRNAYLSPEDRRQALAISRALFEAGERMCGGERDSTELIRGVRECMAALQIDYVSLVDAESMQEVCRIEGKVALAAAAVLPTARLIDNIIYDPVENRVF